MRNILVLMTGTALAQLISVAVAPLLSRLYDPSAFGILGIYTSIVGIIGSIATLRYDQAIILPKRIEDAANLLAISFFAVLATTVLTVVGCTIFGSQIVALMKSPSLSNWLWLLPVSVFALGLNQSLNAWCTRQKKFHRTSFSQVTRSLAIVVTQVFGGIRNIGVIGLIGGTVIGDLCANTTLASKVIKEDKEAIRGYLSTSNLKYQASKYRDFPLYGGTQNLLNSVSQNIPLLLMSYFFNTSVVGFYALGMRLLQLPMNLVLTSLRQVFFQKASEVYNSNGNTFILFKKVTIRLLLLATIPCLLLFLFAPPLFSFILGSKWVIAGEYARWLVLWLSVMFANVPAIIFAQVYRKQKNLLIQDMFLLFCRCIALVIGGMYLTALGTVVLYSIVGLIFNVYIIFWMGMYLRSASVKTI